MTAEMTTAPAVEQEHVEPLPERPCSHCGTMFTPEWDTQLYCTPGHRNEARAEAMKLLPQRPCGYCGAMFAPTSEGHTFCKPTHKAKAQALRKREREAAGRRPCGYCGARFMPESDTQLYCSPAHETKAAKRRQSENGAPESPAPPAAPAPAEASIPQRPCGFCGEMFTPAMDDHEYCSASHWEEAKARRKEARRGPLPQRRCEFCSAEFTPTAEDQAFCRKSHRNKASARRKEEREALAGVTSGPLCPHPLKKSYSSPEQAQLAVWEASNPDLRLYRCRCGALHYGHPKRKSATRKQTRQEAA